LKKKKKKLAKSTRWHRKAHRFIAIPFLVFIVLMSITGILLTWKAELGLKPQSQKASVLKTPLVSLNTIESNAKHYIDNLGLDTTINRIDYRPRKGIAKVRFETHFTELQIDCYTGKVISKSTRTADVIEMIHDGSILDYFFNAKQEPTKLAYSTLVGLSLLFLSFTGFWLWLKPKQMKRHKSN